MTNAGHSAGNYFATLTPEQRQINLAKAHQARIDKAVQREANKHNLKLHYLDAGHWAALASKYGVRMPNAEEQADAPTIRKYIKRVGIEFTDWNDHYTSVAYFLQHNPKITKYAVAGLILEIREGLS